MKAEYPPARTRSGPDAAASSGPRPWWDGYFDREFIRLYSPFLPPARSRREVAGILSMLALPSGSRVLDLACGWGRHAIRLAGAGLAVTGLDFSETLLRSARQRAERAGVEVEWVRADMRDLAWESEFDAVLSLFSSLGYFASAEEDLHVLMAVQRALRPGGAFLLETMHRDHIAREFTARDWWETEDGATVWVEREFDAVAGVVREHWRWTRDGKVGRKQHQLRARTVGEWIALLGDAGLHVEEAFADWNGTPFSHQSEQLILLTRRPA